MRGEIRELLCKCSIVLPELYHLIWYACQIPRTVHIGNGFVCDVRCRYGSGGTGEDGSTIYESIVSLKEL
jgi:hypothetical protein